MTRATFIGFLVLGLVCAVLAYGQLTEPAPIGGGQTGDANPAPSRTSKNDLALADLEREVEVLKATVDGQRKRIDGLEETLARAEARALPTAVAEGPARVAEVPIAAGLEEQVTAILERRDEERRRRSREERVERMAGFFLRDIQVTDQQKKQFIEIVAAYWDERGKLMQREYSTPEERRAATDGLAADRDVKLQQVFDAAQYAQIAERLDRMNRGPGGRGGRPGRRGR
jgi:hypothetical protein